MTHPVGPDAATPRRTTVRDAARLSLAETLAGSVAAVDPAGGAANRRRATRTPRVARRPLDEARMNAMRRGTAITGRRP